MKKTSILAAALFALFAFPMFAEEPKDEGSDVAVETEEQRLACCPCVQQGEETADATEEQEEGYLFASKEDEEGEATQDALV